MNGSFTLEIASTENAAFGEDTTERNAEIARILRHVADRLEDGQDDGRIFDVNGNRCGMFATYEGER